MTLLLVAEIIGAVTVIGGFVLSVLKFTKKLSAIAEGQKCLLRSDIMAIYYKHCDDDEPTLREYERKTLDALFDAYTAQGGNSFISDLYNNEMRHWHITR